VLAVNLEGKKEIPGLYLSEREGANFWLSVLIFTIEAWKIS
jgi:transposase-like protein